MEDSIENKLTELVTIAYSRAIDSVDLFISEEINKYIDLGFEYVEAEKEILSEYRKVALKDKSFIISSLSKYHSAYLDFVEEPIDWNILAEGSIRSIVIGLLNWRDIDLNNLILDKKNSIEEIESKILCFEIVNRLGKNSNNKQNSITPTQQLTRNTTIVTTKNIFLTNTPPDLTPIKEKIETKTEKLNKGLDKYTFFEQQKLSHLSHEGKNSLISSFIEKGVPYTLAMFDYLGFLKYLSDKFFKTKAELFNCLSNLLDIDVRSIKGNVNVLNDHSKEDRTRYTSFKHKESVQKDFQKLK